MFLTTRVGITDYIDASLRRGALNRFAQALSSLAECILGTSILIVTVETFLNACRDAFARCGGATPEAAWLIGWAFHRIVRVSETDAILAGQRSETLVTIIFGGAIIVARTGAQILADACTFVALIVDRAWIVIFAADQRALGQVNAALPFLAPVIGAEDAIIAGVFNSLTDPLDARIVHRAWVAVITPATEGLMNASKIRVATI